MNGGLEILAAELVVLNNGVEFCVDKFFEALINKKLANGEHLETVLYRIENYMISETLKSYLREYVYQHINSDKKAKNKKSKEKLTAAKIIDMQQTKESESPKNER